MGRTRDAAPQPYWEYVVDADGTKVKRQRTKNGKLGWRLRYFDPRTGRQPEQTFYGSRDQAVRELSKLTTAIVESSAPVAHARSITVGEWAETWLRDIYPWKVRPSKNGAYPGKKRPRSTYVKVKNLVGAQLLPALDEKTRMRAISHDMLVEAISGMTLIDRETGKSTDIPLAPSSKESVAGAARSMFRDAKRAGVIVANPAADLPTVWGESGTRRTALVPSILEVEKLAAAMDKTWPLPPWCRDLAGPHGEGRGDIIRVIAFLGTRFSEIAAMPDDLVDLSARVAWMRDTATESGGRRDHREEEGKSTAAVRHLAIVDQAVAPLQRLRAIRERGAKLEPTREQVRQARGVKRAPNRPVNDRWKLVLCGEQGGFQSYGAFRKKLAVAQKESGVSYTAHDLRHVAASVLIATPGVTDEQVREQMGHASVRTTHSVYRHLFRVDKRELARRISAKIAALTEQEAAAAEAEAQAEAADEHEDTNW